MKPTRTRFSPAGLALLLAAALLAGAAANAQKGKQKDDFKDGGNGTLVTLDGYASKTPPGWKREKPANLLRKYQFRLAKAEGDGYDGEVMILPNFGGPTEQKHVRWKADFIPPEGKTIDEVSKVEKFPIGPKAGAVVLDVSGTWVYKERPFDPSSKPEKRPGYRVVWVILETEKDSYQIRLSGPQKTVEKHKKAFDDWLRGFKKK